MNREHLVEMLDRMSPALATNDVVAEYKHFWFDGETVTAYNDQIGMSAPCKTDFRGGVPGMQLLSLLKASRAESVEFSSDGKDVVVVKAASSKIRLAMLPISRWEGMFEMPEFHKDEEMSTTPSEFMRAVENCLRSVSQDTTHPEHLGVTVIGVGKAIELYSTNQTTISHSYLPLKGNQLKGRAIMSTHFCKQMIAIADSDAKGTRLEIHISSDRNYSLFGGKNGVKLWGKLVDYKKPFDFIGLLAKFFPKEYEKKLVTIPTKLELILERAVVVASIPVDRVRTEIEVKNGKAVFYTESKVSAVTDTCDLKDHPDVKVCFDPKLVKQGYGNFDKMLVTNSAFIMASDDHIYMVAAEG